MIYLSMDLENINIWGGGVEKFNDLMVFIWVKNPYIYNSQKGLTIEEEEEEEIPHF